MIPILVFVQSQMSVFNRKVLKLEKPDSSVLEVSEISEETLTLINWQRERRFLPLKVL